MKMRFLDRGILLLAVVAACLVVCRDARAAGHANGAVDASGGRIAALIRQLGDEQYSVREQAQDHLANLGAEAFDALVAAEQSDDIEIASRAAYLVHLIRIDWVRDSDSPQIKEILKDYDNQPEDDRRQCMQQLAERMRDVGLEPLCRLIRFERSQLLSKQGAILVLDQPEPPESRWLQRASIITGSLNGSSRAASKWLLAYVQFHTDPEAALARWDKLVDEELAVVEPSIPQAEAKIQTSLLRRQAEMLLARNHSDQALLVMRKMIDRETDDVESLIEFVEWLAKNKAWSVMDDVTKRFDRTFAADRRLLYSLAQARKMQVKDKLAEQCALQAFQISSGADDISVRRSIAFWLERGGMLPWCEREFRYVISRGVADSEEVVESRCLLSDMLHDQDRDGEAAEVLMGLVDQLGRNGFPQKLTAMLHPPKSIRSRMYFFYACQCAARKDAAGQITQLDLAKDSDPTDGDVLIALYHLPSQDEHRRQQTLKLIRDAAEQFRNELKDDPNQYSIYNEYAWLIANTEGDLDQALEYAHKAVDKAVESVPAELEPFVESGLLDTLAHCYAAKKDFENAVKYQSRAAELYPYSRQIRRALDEYRRALDKSKQRK